MRNLLPNTGSVSCHSTHHPTSPLALGFLQNWTCKQATKAFPIFKLYSSFPLGMDLRGQWWLWAAGRPGLEGSLLWTLCHCDPYRLCPNSNWWVTLRLSSRHLPQEASDPSVSPCSCSLCGSSYPSTCHLLLKLSICPQKTTVSQGYHQAISNYIPGSHIGLET